MADEEAAEAFRTLSDSSRIAILRTFAAVLDEKDLVADAPMPTLSFSELYDRVDIDSTSRLSYHLDELDGTYVTRTEDGWKFTFAGEAIVRLVLSGAYAGGIDFDSVETPGRCLHCGEEKLEATVDDRALVHVCQACDSKMGGFPVTPAQVQNRDPESLLESAKAVTQSKLRQYRNGICTECGGVVDMAVETEAVAEDASEIDQFIATGRCEQCWRTLNGPLPMWLTSHPASVAFHWDHGIDVLSLGMRDISEKLGSGEWTTERVDTDPAEYEVTYRVGANALRLVVDDELTVARTERVRRDSVG